MTVAWSTLIPLILILIPWQLHFAGFDLRNPGTFLWPSQMKNYGDISIGMSLNDVEKFSGKRGRARNKFELPRVSNGHGGDKPNVERVYRWEFERDQRIWIGVTDGRVVSKDYYPAL